jgi:DNA-binding response OmpR family regulator
MIWNMLTQTNILLVEDDINLSTVLADYLRSKGYVVEQANNGAEAWDLILIKDYDLIISDIMMPKMNGYELLKLIRQKHDRLPILILSAKTDRDDIIRAYELGCDDYVTKPFSMDILICKIEAIMRRSRKYMESNQSEWLLGNLLYDSVRQQLGDKHLSTRENELLKMLCQNLNNLVDRNRILMSIWGEDTYFNARSLSVYINHLRNYLGEDNPMRIMSVHGKGYKLVQMNM